MINSALLSQENYTMRFANGDAVDILFAQNLSPWMKKFASIMGLRSSQLNGRSKLIFVRKVSDKYQVGWQSQDLRAVKIWTHERIPDVVCEISEDEGYELDIIKMWLVLNPIYNKIHESGGLSLHSALVERKGKGILLAGPGGAGKSTCCRRIPLPWKAICDDEVLVVRTEDRYMAHPFPTWSEYLMKRSEKTWDTGHSLPLSAIFFLEQAEEDNAIPLGSGQASILINESSLQIYNRNLRNLDSDIKKKIRNNLFINACKMAKAVPAFILRVSFNGRFWDEIEKMLKKS